MKPSPGDRYTKNGRTFTVHYVIRGEVYGATTLRSDPTLVEGVRLSLKQFERDTRDAKREPR